MFSSSSITDNRYSLNEITAIESEEPPKEMDESDQEWFSPEQPLNMENIQTLLQQTNLPEDVFLSQGKQYYAQSLYGIAILFLKKGLTIAVDQQIIMHLYYYKFLIYFNHSFYNFNNTFEKGIDCFLEQLNKFSNDLFFILADKLKLTIDKLNSIARRKPKNIAPNLYHALPIPLLEKGAQGFLSIGQCALEHSNLQKATEYWTFGLSLTKNNNVKAQFALKLSTLYMNVKEFKAAQVELKNMLIVGKNLENVYLLEIYKFVNKY